MAVVAAIASPLPLPLSLLLLLALLVLPATAASIPAHSAGVWIARGARTPACLAAAAGASPPAVAAAGASPPAVAAAGASPPAVAAAALAAAAVELEPLPHAAADSDAPECDAAAWRAWGMWDAAAAGAGDPAGDTAPDADPDAGGAAACSATCIVADPWTALPPRAATAARIARIDYHAPGSGCAGPLLRAELVPVYAACTRVAAGLFALSAVADSAVALRVCSDAACTACTDPPPAAAWPRAAACASRGPYDVRGLNTTDGGATSSASIPLTAPIILSAVAVAIALVTLTAVVVWLVAMRRGPPLPPLRDQDAQTSLDGRPTIVESTSASVVPAGSLAHLAHDRTSPFSPHALGSPQARAFSASRVVQILEQPHTVVIDYDPQMIDELRLRAGDQVLLESVWSDGWAHGYNITTGERGTLAIATLDANSHLLVPVDDPRLSSSPESFTRPSAESAGTTGDGQRASPSGDDLGQRGSVF